MTTAELLARVEVLRLHAARREAGSPAAPTLPEAEARGEIGMARAAAGADEMWDRRAELLIRAKSSGEQFLAEQISEQLVTDGYWTENARAMGAIIKRLNRQGVIRSTGRFARAKSSNGTYKVIWEKA